MDSKTLWPRNMWGENKINDDIKWKSRRDRGKFQVPWHMIREGGQKKKMDKTITTVNVQHSAYKNTHLQNNN